MSSRSIVRACAALVCLLVLAPTTALAGPTPGTGTASAAAQAKIQPKLVSEFTKSKEATFWVVMNAKADLSAADDVRDWAGRGAYVVQRLSTTATQSQGGVRSYLRARGIAHRTFFIANAIKVTASRQILDALAARSDVKRIIADGGYQIPKPLAGKDQPSILAVEWGIDRIRAPEAWTAFGVRGEGIVVANLDTGVQFDHSALVNQYRGNLGSAGFSHDYNWFDASESCPAPEPCDNIGHGTHTMGTMVGDDGGSNNIGVAPNARWIATKGCGDFFCTFEDLLEAGEWILAPTRMDGTGADPAMRPHVVNNSWGGPPDDDFYQAIVQGWVAAGIFPAFASGNAGPGCRSAGSPGDYSESYSAGAFDIDDKIAFFSSRGPSSFGETKPNLAAPGVDVRSSVPGNGYEEFSGTSMASPHLSGAVALIWSAAPTIVGDIAATRTLLDASSVDTSDLSCGGTAADNNVWGEGSLDAFAAVDASPHLPTGTLAGVVTDSTSGDPLQGATIAATGLGTTRIALTDAAGAYSVTLHVGTYDVDASAFGHVTENATGVAIAEGATTTRDFALVASPTHAVTGTVTDASNAPLAGATVALLSTPIPPVTTDAAGEYSFPNVPEGTYQLQAKGDGCTQVVTRQLIVDGPETSDFTLGPKTDDRGYFCAFIPRAYRVGTTPLDLRGDEASKSVDLPFPFTFYGQTYEKVDVTTNGYISFTGPDVWFSNGTIPSTARPNGAIYAFWDDLFADRTTQVYTRAGGPASDRWFAIEWRDITFYDDTVRLDVEAVLYEDGRVVLQYRKMGLSARERGGGATIGLENAEGTDAFLFSVNEALLTNSEAIVFDLPPAGFAEGTVTDAVDGIPLAGATVTARRSGEIVATTTTDDEGRYRVQLFVGSHSLRASKDGYVTRSGTVTIADDATVTRDFALRSPRVSWEGGDVSLILTRGHTRSTRVPFRNVGLEPLTFEVKEGNVAGGIGEGFAKDPAAGVTTRSAPKGYTAKRAVSTLDTLPGGGGPVLVLMDLLPWGSDSMLRVLDANGIPYEIGDSSMMGADLSFYEAVFIASDQPTSFYGNYADNFANFEAYVSGGGLLWVGAAAWGWNGGDFTGGVLPGGATVTGYDPAAENDVLEPDHPLMQGVPDPFTGTDASHTSFADLPAGTTVIAENPAGRPTLIEYDFGDGRVLAFGQPLEIAVEFGQDGGLILENGVPYAYAFESYTDVPWLSVTPMSGTLASGDRRNLTITVDPGRLDPGLHRARVVLLTNDPQNPLLQVPVTVIVPEYQKGVNAGGLGYTDRAGDRWVADKRFTAGTWGYTNGDSRRFATSSAIAGTLEDPLFQDQRTNPTQYRFTVPNGVYQVELRFAEIRGERANGRLFDVLLERDLVLPAFDIAGEVGRNRADDEMFFVNVSDGVLNVRLVPRAGYDLPVINALRVTQRPDLGF